MSPGRLLIALDQGSSATKGALLAIGGGAVPRPHAGVEAPVPVRSQGPHVEHDPDAILAGVRQVLGRLLEEARAAGGEPEGIALACQRSTCLLWERESGRPLTAALSWRDRRESGRSERLAPVAGEVAGRTGLRLSPHYAAPKLAGLLDATAGARRRAEAGELLAGTLDAFLVHHLTGRPSTEPGQAGRTLLYNLEDDRWDPWLCELFGIPAAALPELLPSAGLRGAVEGIPLAATAGDQQAALLGHGGWRPGIAAVHFGTGAFVLAGTGTEAVRHAGLLTAVLASTPEARHFQIEGSVNSAGDAIDWAAGLTGANLTTWRHRDPDPRTLPRVFPAFAGAGAPWWRPEASAVVAGLTSSSSGGDLVGGVLVGLAQRVADCTEAIAGAGVEIGVLRASGRLTRLRGLIRLVSELTGLPVEVARDEEAGLAGLARLACAALGDSEPLGAAARSGVRIEPSWPAGRRQRTRSDWRAFARAALELGASSPASGL